ATSIGSTDTTGTPMRLPTTSAIVLLPAAGRPAITMSMAPLYEAPPPRSSPGRRRHSHQFGGTGDDRDRVALHREETVLDTRRHDAAVGRGHARLTRRQNREHGLVTGQDADLTLGGTRDDLRGLARPQLAFRRDDGDVEGHDQPFSFCS